MEFGRRSCFYVVTKVIRCWSLSCDLGLCSFGLFNYDSFVSFRAIGVIWGIRELTAELMCLLFSVTLPCPYPVGDSALFPTLLWDR